MKKYMLTSPNYPDGIICGFNGDSVIIFFQIEGNPSSDLIIALLQKLPLTEQAFLDLRKRTGIKIEIVPTDLSFECFWSEYGYKFGKKDRVKKIWESMNDNDKVKALAAIKPYKTWLLRKNIDMVYPETYLSQRRFENDFNA
jgi:hypothetical protein